MAGKEFDKILLGSLGPSLQMADFCARPQQAKKQRSFFGHSNSLKSFLEKQLQKDLNGIVGICLYSLHYLHLCILCATTCTYPIKEMQFRFAVCHAQLSYDSGAQSARSFWCCLRLAGLPCGHKRGSCRVQRKLNTNANNSSTE